MTHPTTTDWRDAIDTFYHRGPGGDAALAAAHPDLVHQVAVCFHVLVQNPLWLPEASVV